MLVRRQGKKVKCSPKIYSAHRNLQCKYSSAPEEWRSRGRGEGLKRVACPVGWGLGWDRVRKKSDNVLGLLELVLYPRSRTVRILHASLRGARALACACPVSTTRLNERATLRSALRPRGNLRRKRQQSGKKGKKKGRERERRCRKRGNFILSHSVTPIRRDPRRPFSARYVTRPR